MAVNPNKPLADAAASPVIKPLFHPSVILRCTHINDTGPNGTATDKPSMAPDVRQETAFNAKPSKSARPAPRS